MREDHLTDLERTILLDLFTSYVEIRCDVLANKNLNQHLTTINHDLSVLNQIIDVKEASNTQSLSFYRVTNHLARLKDVVQRKEVAVKI